MPKEVIATQQALFPDTLPKDKTKDKTVFKKVPLGNIKELFRTGWKEMESKEEYLTKVMTSSVLQQLDFQAVDTVRTVLVESKSGLKGKLTTRLNDWLATYRLTHAPSKESPNFLKQEWNEESSTVWSSARGLIAAHTSQLDLIENSFINQEFRIQHEVDLLPDYDPTNQLVSPPIEATVNLNIPGNRGLQLNVFYPYLAINPENEILLTLPYFSKPQIGFDQDYKELLLCLLVPQVVSEYFRPKQNENKRCVVETNLASLLVSKQPETWIRWPEDGKMHSSFLCFSPSAIKNFAEDLASVENWDFRTKTALRGRPDDPGLARPVAIRDRITF